MDAERLHELTREAVDVAGWPSWASPDEPDQRETLVFLAAREGGEPASWGLAPTEATSPADDDLVPLDPAMARAIIGEHLRLWLAERGWQVQLTACLGKQRWRLVDCLAVTDGGGDRLDADYPAGEDELAVLCEAVVAVARWATGGFARPPVG